MLRLLHLLTVLNLLSFCQGYEDLQGFYKLSSPETFAELLYSTTETLELSKPCSKDLLTYMIALRSKNIWAWKMFDAGTKIPSGLTSGNWLDLGEFDQCMKIKKDHLNDHTVYGRYCLGVTSVTSLLPLSVNVAKPPKVLNQNSSARSPRMVGGGGMLVGFATCLPHACGPEDVQTLYSKIFNNIEFKNEYCQSKGDSQEFTTGDIGAISFFSVILGIMTLSSLYDVALYYLKKKPCHPILISFSVLTNGKKLLTLEKNSKQVTCIYGIRVISMMWVVLGHTFGGEPGRPTKNVVDMMKFQQEKGNMYLLSAPLSVDTFFLLSGFLVSYLFLDATKKGATFNILMFYFHRYIRLTPILGAVMLFHMYILKFLGSGPLWKARTQPDSCREYWWSALLYVQNFVNPREMCLGHSWYLSLDTQMFFFAPILLIPLKRWPIMGLLLTAVCLILSLLSGFVTAWVYKLYALINANVETLDDFMVYYYTQPHTRAGPWLVGIILGYVLFKLKQRNIRQLMPTIAFVLLWLVSMGIMATCTFTGRNTLFSFHEYNQIVNALHVALLRTGWAVGVSWVIFACATGGGGPINWFLSLPMFQLVSKFTYGMYLFHLLFISIVYDQRRVTEFFTPFNVYQKFWGILVYVLVVSVVLTLAFESPVIAIEKSIFGNNKGSQNNPKRGSDIKEVQSA